VIPEKCLGDETVYKACKYYREPTSLSLTQGKLYQSRFGRPLLLIHSLTIKPNSPCEFFVVEKHESGVYLAGCEVLGRYLTRYEVPLCEKHWDECPYRRVGLLLKEEK
jgi:uncharacterized RmlC-like cupin family protein